MPYVTHYQGERKQDRRTPREFFDSLHSRFNFTLDGAASSENALLPRYSSEVKPLPWQGERVFCNPPWSSIPPFVEHMATADLAVLLVPARTNCGWFHRALELGAIPEYFKTKPNFGGPWNSPIDCLLLVCKSCVELTLDERLGLVMEEAAEIIQATSKCLRFGFEHVGPGDYGVNHEVLAREYGDLLGIMDYLPLNQSIISLSRSTKLLRAVEAKRVYGRRTL